LVSSDYGAIEQTIVFKPGETSKMIPVPIVDDLIREPDETFVIRLRDGVGVSLSSSYAVQVTILNDDTRTAVYLPMVRR
jgi:serralysin